LDVEATDAEQAICWFDADQDNAAECERESEWLSSCILQAVDYCADLNLDNERVADACFLSYLRAGNPDKALEVARYLQNLSKKREIDKCSKALESVYVQVISNPPGADITVGDKHYGNAPKRVRLTDKWWTKEVSAVFRTQDGEEKTKVPPDELLQEFNPRTCVMNDLVIEGPERGFFEGRLWTWVALGGAVAFGGAGLYFQLHGDASYDDLMKECPDGCSEREIEEKIDDSGVETDEVLRNIAFSLAGACLITAGVLYFVEGAPETESVNPIISIGPTGVRVRGSF